MVRIMLCFASTHKKVWKRLLLTHIKLKIHLYCLAWLRFKMRISCRLLSKSDLKYIQKLPKIVRGYKYNIKL